MEWFLKCLKNYATFNGRARRKEYWMFTLFNLIITLVLMGIDIALQLGYLQIIYAVAVLLPSLAVSVRRLHDTNRSGWWLFIALIPFIGSIWLLVLMVIEGEHQENQYGPDPKAIENEIANATPAENA
ncbi:MAG TPA: DUF805 domain-containing protein [Paludibacteraceae bacterium]|jgi:uncharacterized membrane protein YhaH (DUF805 family)|nr:DUF805 domain-containing protein [Paludibacteraceae bacterium]HPH63251.1 DUF805 domain-containing protein [Paludibacteraceae bacterium]